MSFSTLNSSFIFDRRLRSMTECAVFLAIFLPATLVALGCFLLAGADVADEPLAPLLFEPLVVCCAAVLLASSVCCDLGFICMIFRDRVGGGGSEKSELAICCDGWAPLPPAVAMAGGGRAKDIFSVGRRGHSLPRMSEEEAGVGGKLDRGIANLERICQCLGMGVHPIGGWPREVGSLQDMGKD